jgi:hypothetical protein
MPKIPQQTGGDVVEVILADHREEELISTTYAGLLRL